MPVAVESIKFPRRQGARRADARRNEPEREQQFLARDPRLQASIQLQKELTSTLGGGVEAASVADREAAKRLTDIIDPYGYSLEDALHLVQLHGADTESLSTAISQLVEEHLQKGYICEWKSTNRKVKEKNTQLAGTDFRGGRRRGRPQQPQPQQQQAPRPERTRRGRPQGDEAYALSPPVDADAGQTMTPTPTQTPTPIPNPAPVEEAVGEITTASSAESRGKASTWATLLRGGPNGSARSKSLSNADKIAPEVSIEPPPAEAVVHVEAPPTQPPSFNNTTSSPASTLEEPAPPEPLPEAKMLDETAETTTTLVENRNQSVPLPEKPHLDERAPSCDKTIELAETRLEAPPPAADEFPPPPSTVVIPPSATAFHHKTLEVETNKPSVTLPAYLGVEESAPSHVSYIFGSLRWDGEKPTRYEPPSVPLHKPHRSENIASYRVDAEDAQRPIFRSPDMGGAPTYYPNNMSQPQAQSAYAPMWQSSGSADYAYTNEASAYGTAQPRQDFAPPGPRRHQQPVRQSYDAHTARENSNYFLNSANRPVSIMGAYGSALTRSVIPPPYSMNVSSNNALVGIGERSKNEAVRSGLMGHNYDPHQPQHLGTSASSRSSAQNLYPNSTSAMYMPCPYPPYGNGHAEDNSTRNNPRTYTPYDSSGGGLTLGGYQQGGHTGGMAYASTYGAGQYETQSPGEPSATAADRYMTDSRVMQGQSWANTRDNDYVQAQAKRVMLSTYNHGAFDLAGADHLLQQANPMRMDVAPTQAAPQTSFASLSNPSTIPSSYPRSYAAFAFPPGLPNYTYDRRY